MVSRNVFVRVCLVWLVSVLPLMAQQAVGQATSTVPGMVNFNGTLFDDNRKPLTGVVGVTFSLYKDSQGGAPLWLETQNVTADKNGRFTVMLGSASNRGLPAELFASGEARWLGVQAQGQAEQSRVLLLSVPYAMKAADAETIGGLPASAFVLAAPAAGSGSTTSLQNNGPASHMEPSVGGSGTTNFIPLWTPNGTTLGNSVFFQSGSGSSAKVGLGITSPLATLDINGITLVRGTLETITKGVAKASKGLQLQPF